MSEDADQRNLIGTSRSIGMNLGMIIVNSCSAGMALHFSGSNAEVATGHGYMMTAIVYSIIAIPLFLIVFATSKEVIGTGREQQKISPKQTVKNFCGCYITDDSIHGKNRNHYILCYLLFRCIYIDRTDYDNPFNLRNYRFYLCNTTL